MVSVHPFVLRGVDAVQEATGTRVPLVATGELQVVVVHVGALGPLAEQVCTAVGPVLLLLQDVAVQLFVELAGVATHAETAVGPVLLLLQVIRVVPLVVLLAQLSTGTLELSTTARQTVVTLPDTPSVQVAV